MATSRSRLLVVLILIAVIAVVAIVVIGRRGRSERSGTKGSPSERESPEAKPRTRPAAAPTTPKTGGAPLRASVLKGKWGSSPGEFGHLREEGAPEAPMSAAVAANGDLLVLDQVNTRLQRFRADGSLDRAFAIGTDTAQDVAIGPDGRVTVLDRFGNELSIYDENGNLVSQLPVAGGPVDQATGVTGVYADSTGIYVEREHTEVVRVAGPDGTPDPKRPTEPGRPSRDGLYFLNAALLDAPAGRARVRVFDRDANLVWERAVQFPRMILHLILLDSDKRGHLFLGALVAREGAEPPHEMTEVANVIVRLSLGDGASDGMIEIPAPSTPEEMYRELIVTDEGEILQMVPSADGFEIVRWVFP